jgi:hypothetical protein
MASQPGRIADPSRTQRETAVFAGEGASPSARPTDRHRDAVSPAVRTLARDLDAYEARRALVAAHHHAALETTAARARAAMLDAAAERALLADVAFLRTLGAAYRDPEQARRAFLAAATRDPADAVRQMRERPERFGPLRTVDRPVWFGLATRPDDRAARVAAREAAATGEASLAATRTVHEVTTVVRTRRIEAEHAQSLRTVERFNAALTVLYREPEEARRNFETLAAHRGVAHAGKMMRQHPWLFAPLREPQAPDALHRAAADRAAARGIEAVRATRDLPPAERRVAHDGRHHPALAEERAATLTAIDRATVREATLATHLAALPDRAALRERIATTMARLTPTERAQAQQVIPAPRLAVAVRLERMARAVALGRSEPEW